MTATAKSRACSERSREDVLADVFIVYGLTDFKMCVGEDLEMQLSLRLSHHVGRGALTICTRMFVTK